MNLEVIEKRLLGMDNEIHMLLHDIYLIEVAIVMSRAVGSEIAKEVYENIKKNAVSILYLNESFTEYCMEKGIETHDRRFFHNMQEHHPELKVHFLREMNIDD